MANITDTADAFARPKPDVVVSVGLVADRLIRSIQRGGSGAEIDQRALLERLLAVAAEAEQRISEQTHRIQVLEALSVTDELTGLINRRGFMRELRRALADAKRQDNQGVLAYLDVDGFKLVNDEYGHHAGDELLHRVAEILAGNIRTTDVVARLGGDEFAALLTNTELEDGYARAKDLELMINRASVPYGNSKILVRASFGIVGYDGQDEADALLQRADRAMYAEKHGGGNGEDGGNVVRSIFDGANSITLPTRDKQRARANR
jgi:diguanylate cyclase (GGDEF)-like protein